MGMTFSELKDLTLNLVFEANYDRFAEAFVERTINLGCVDFLDKTEVEDTHFTRLTVEDQLWYKIAGRAKEITRVEWYDLSGTKRRMLVKKTMEEMDEEYPYDDHYDADADWHQSTGDPKVWIPRERDVIGIWPAPDTQGDTLYLYGRRRHTDLSADGSEPKIPDEFRHIPCIYAARMLLRSDNDEKAPSFEKWYKEEVFFAKKQVKERKEKMPARWRMYTY